MEAITMVMIAGHLIVADPEVVDDITVVRSAASVIIFLVVTILEVTIFGNVVVVSVLVVLISPPGFVICAVKDNT